MEEKEKAVSSKKNILVIIIAVVILLVIGGAFVYSKFLKKSSGGIVSELSQATSLKDLIAKNIPQTCTYSIEGNNGTVYISGGKMRGDFEVKTEEETRKSHVIVDGDTTYMWNEGEKTGYKIVAEKVENKEDETSPETPDNSQSGPVSFDQDYNYACKPWVPDGSMFNPPSSVNFINFGEVPTASGNGSMPAQCSVCDSLTGNNKTQCLTSLKCN